MSDGISCQISLGVGHLFYWAMAYISRIRLFFVGQVVGVDAAKAYQGQGEKAGYGVSGVVELLVGGVQADVAEVHVFHGGSAAGFGAVVELNTKYYVIDCCCCCHNSGSFHSNGMHRWCITVGENKYYR